MKITAVAGGQEITLPNDLLWEDEFSWIPPVAKETYSLTGALIIETASRKAGRPITLRAPDDSMAWVTRAQLELLRTMSSIPEKKFYLRLEYPSDTRQFLVMFKQAGNPVEARPVRGFPGHDTGDFFLATIRLMEVV